MTDASPLLAHATPSAVVAYGRGGAVTAVQFLADARDLARRLPPSRHVLNVCADRYWFTVGLAACLMTGRVSLLPSTHTPEVIGRLTDFAPDAFCMTDEPACSIALPQFQVTPMRGTDLAWQVPDIPDDQLAAVVFTSGSTGAPMPHRKTWGNLARCVRAEAVLLGMSDGASHTVVGTVPAQHMYGFETTVLLPLVSGNAFAAERPFFPADICATLAAVPRPRILVTTPVHLRALLRADIPLPEMDLIVSATAPLTMELASEVEARCDSRLLEIYGSTETGQIATRRTASSPVWRLWPDVRLTARAGVAFAHGGHVDEPTALCDVIELLAEDCFLLHGRTADLVNVAGKRSSFGYLDAQLGAIPGVTDGAFFLPEEDGPGATRVARLAAVVVAPGLTIGQLTDQLRLRLDPAFLPRPLIQLEHLPRNATGKLPRQVLLSLLGGHDRSHGTGSAPVQPVRGALIIPADHAAYAGHFPGSPILPGAALLDAVLQEVAGARRLDLRAWGVRAAKFLQIVTPGMALTLEHEESGTSAISFAVHNAAGVVASGVLAEADGQHGT